MALCASVMTGIYASPVFAGDVVENSITGNNSGLSFTIDRNKNPDGSDAGGIYFSGSNGVSGQIYGHLKIGGEKIAGALIGQSLNLKSMSISTVDGDETITETITVENIKNWNNAAKANENVAGIRREGDETSGGHRTIVEEQLVVNRESKVISNLNASFTVDSSGNLKASTFGNNIGTFSVNEDGVVTAADVTVDGHTGGFNVTGQNDEVVSYLRAGDLRINDFSSWNSSGLTVGDFQVANEGSNRVVTLKNHQTQETVFEANGETGIVTASGVTFNDGQVEGSSIELTNDLGKTHTITLGNQGQLLLGNAVLDEGSYVGDAYFGNGTIQVIDDSNNTQTTTAMLGGNYRDGGYLDLRDSDSTLQRLTGDQLANINSVVQEDGNVVANSLNVANGAFEVTNDGTVNGPGNFTIYNNGVMYAPDGGTIGGVIFNNDGSVAGTHFSIAANGEITATNFNAGSYNLVEVGNDLTALQGTVDGTTADITALEQKTAGISKSGPVTTVEGVDFTQGHMDADYVLTDGLKVNGISDLDGVQVHNGSIYAENDSYVGGVQLADGLVNGVNMDNLRGIERVDYGNSVGETTIEGATTFDQGGMGVYTDTGSSIVGGGNVVITDNSGSFTQIMGGDITAETLNGKNIDEMFDTVTETNANVGGIKRIDSNGDGTLDTTTIEDTLSVSSDQILAQTGSSQLVITEDVAGLSSGNASFALTNNELQLSVAGNGLLVNQFGTNLNGTVNFIGHDGNSYTLSDLEGRVYDLEQKTQNITSTDPGQGGGSEVPPTDEGHTGFEGDVTVGGDINADEGNFNKVNTDEITVGDSTFIDGDSVNSNEGNFKDKVTVGGEGGTSITGDGMTVGTADKGTTVSDSGVSIKNEYGSVETGVVDGKNDVVVTDEDGNRTSLVDTAGRVDNLEQGVAELNNRVGELEDRIDKVGAMAAAIANLRTMGYDPAAPTEVAVGLGQYRDETGAALGLFHYPNRDFMLSLSVSTSGDEVMGGIGATWKFGRKSPEKVAEIKKAQAEADVRRAEAQKLAKAEELKAAAKEAKIKAQMERHAKLAAERAAEAETK